MEKRTKENVAELLGKAKQQLKEHFENNVELLKKVSELRNCCKNLRKEASSKFGYYNTPWCGRECPFFIDWDFEDVCALDAIHYSLTNQGKEEDDED